jgi:hypothetical protein
MFDDQRPTLTLTFPRPGSNPMLSRILVGLHDYNTGLDEASFSVTADVPIDGIPTGGNLAPRFGPLTDGLRELKLKQPLESLGPATLTIAIRDREGNTSRIVRTFSVGARSASEAAP